MRKILHIGTGGTISGCESDYSAIDKIAKFFTDAIDIGKYLSESLHISAEYSTREVCFKDSRDINEYDRKIIQQEIERAYEEGIRHFFITHGTYTMPETGKYLIENLPQEILEKVNAVITGAMYPMNLVGGDGLLNIGASVSSLINSDLFFGVKINMHGKNWDPYKIQKDAKNLIFEEKISG